MIARWFLGSVPLLALGSLLALAPNQAQAAPPRDSIHDSRGYVYGSPAFMYVPLGDDDVDDLVEVGYQWGFGVGGRIPLPTRSFVMTAGFGFEHAPLSLDDDVDDWCGLLGDCDVRAHALRLLPELRFGGGTDHLFAYGVLAPGLGIVTSEYDATALNADFHEDDTDVGFNLGLGAGIQVIVWRGLFVGGELGFDLGFYGEDDDDDIRVDLDGDDYGFYALDIKAIVGWMF